MHPSDIFNNFTILYGVYSTFYGDLMDENLLNFSFSGMIMKNYFCSVVKGRISYCFSPGSQRARIVIQCVDYTLGGNKYGKR